VSGVAARGAPKSGATLTVTANGAATRLDVPAGGGRCEVALDLRGEELVVACAGDAELLLLDPKLLR
jgi:hypothetical protein